MYCGNCGAKNNDGAFFCLNCGASLDISSANSIDHDLQNENNVFQDNQKNVLVDIDYMHEHNKKNGKKKSKVAAAILGTLTGLIAVASIIIYMFLPQIERGIMGETTYYLYSEYNSAVDFFESGIIQNSFKNTTFSSSSDIKFSADITYDDAFIREFASSLAVVLNQIQLNLSTNIDVDNKAASVELTGLSSGQNFFDGVINIQDGAVLLGLPEIAEKYIELASSGENSEDFLDEIFGMPFEDLKKEFAETVVEILNDNITENDIRTQKPSSGDIYQITTFEFSEKTLINIFSDAVDALKGNDIINTALKNALTNELVTQILVLLDSVDGNEIYDSLMEGLDYMSEEINDGKEVVSDDIFVTYSVSYDKKGNILSRQLTTEKISESYSTDSSETVYYEPARFIKLDTKIDKDNIQIEFDAIWDDESFADLSLNNTEKSNKNSGNINLSLFDNELLINIDYSDICSVKVNEINTLTGNASASVNVDGWNLLKLSTNSSAEKDTVKNEIIADVCLDPYENFYINADLNISTQLSDTANIAKVDISNDEPADALFEYFESAMDVAMNVLEESNNDFVKLLEYLDAML